MHLPAIHNSGGRNGALRIKASLADLESCKLLPLLCAAARVALRKLPSRFPGSPHTTKPGVDAKTASRENIGRRAMCETGF